jgi:hypothetical protein
MLFPSPSDALSVLLFFIVSARVVIISLVQNLSAYLLARAEKDMPAFIPDFGPRSRKLLPRMPQALICRGHGMEPECKYELIRRAGYQCSRSFRK